MQALVIGDPHCSPDNDNRRFDWLGRAILDINPDMVLCTGDFADMASLSSYDKGKRSGEMRRYRNDIQACHDALRRINAPLEEFNRSQRNKRKAQRRFPRKIMLLGNHEDRINRAVNIAPELEGAISTDDLQYSTFGWEAIQYKTVVNIEGIYCCHYFPSGTQGLPIGGSNIAASLLGKNMVSSLVGHSHLLDYAVRSKPDGQKVMALSAGCYLEEATFDNATYDLWWSGLCVLHDLHEGTFDLELISIDRVRRLYG